MFEEEICVSCNTHVAECIVEAENQMTNAKCAVALCMPCINAYDILRIEDNCVVGVGDDFLEEWLYN